MLGTPLHCRPVPPPVTLFPILSVVIGSASGRETTERAHPDRPHQKMRQSAAAEEEADFLPSSLSLSLSFGVNLSLGVSFFWGGGTYYIHTGIEGVQVPQN